MQLPSPTNVIVIRRAGWQNLHDLANIRLRGFQDDPHTRLVRETRITAQMSHAGP